MHSKYPDPVRPRHAPRAHRRRDRGAGPCGEGDARIRRIVDYLILINGDLQHIARATGEPVVPLERRRKSG
jgi:hypothetical protein